MPSDPDVYPYSTIAYITDTIGGQIWQGSGVLIAPDEVLTASHVVYSSTLGTATAIQVSLGYNQGIAGIGTTAASFFHYNLIQDPANTLTLPESQSDYALIHLAKPFTGVTPMAMLPDYAGGPATVSGYPISAAGQLLSSPQTVAQQPNLAILTGTSIGEGSSGGPVWITGANGAPDVVGLVSTSAGGVGTQGYFTQITASTLRQIQAWIAEDQAGPSLSVFDATTNQTVMTKPVPYSGPVAGVLDQYLNLTSDNLSITATSPGWFIHTGSGTDAIRASGGTNVLDGGTGSNFLTGGTGNDTFFADARNATADIWDTIANFHAGDAATLWGVSQAGFSVAWADNQGAGGYLGLTLHASAAGTPNAALTLAGFQRADLSNGRLSVSFGTDAGSGSAFMYVAANG